MAVTEPDAPQAGEAVEEPIALDGRVVRALRRGEQAALVVLLEVAVVRERHPVRLEVDGEVLDRGARAGAERLAPSAARSRSWYGPSYEGGNKGARPRLQTSRFQTWLALGEGRIIARSCYSRQAMFTTLVSTEELAAHLDDPRWIVFDCRHDLAQPGLGPDRVSAVAHPRRAVHAYGRGPRGPGHRHERPPSAAGPGRLRGELGAAGVGRGHAGRRLRRARRRERGAPVVDAALAGPRRGRGARRRVRRSGSARSSP